MRQQGFRFKSCYSEEAHILLLIHQKEDEVKASHRVVVNLVIKTLSRLGKSHYL